MVPSGGGVEVDRNELRLRYWQLRIEAILLTAVAAAMKSLDLKKEKVLVQLYLLA